MTMKIISIFLLGFFLGCTSPPSPVGPLLWDVSETVAVKGVLQLDAWGTSVVLESSQWGLMLTPGNKPIPSGNEGCMCVYMAEPPNLARAVAQLFRTAPVTRAQLNENDLRQLEQKLHPTVYLSIEDKGSEALVTVVVRLKEKELGRWRGAVSKSLLYSREEYTHPQKDRQDVGFIGLMARLVRQALTWQDGPDDSTVFLSVQKFLETVAAN